MLCAPYFMLGCGALAEQVFLVQGKLKQEHEQGLAVSVFIDDFLFFSYF